jgi:cytidine deaminase
LLNAAKKAVVHAHAPYSKFRVGAAVSTNKGIFVGVNVESASLGLTLCAERTAIASAIANGATKFYAIGLICADASQTFSITPCGACRQWLSEFFKPDAHIYVEGLKKHFTIGRLLPESFKLKAN